MDCKANMEQQLVLHHTTTLLLFRRARPHHRVAEQTFTLVAVLFPSTTFPIPTIPLLFAQCNDADFKRGRWI